MINCTESLYINFDFVDVDNLTCNTTQTIVFTSTDDCGNLSECSSNLFLEGDETPDLTCPEELIYNLTESNIENSILSEIDVIIQENEAEGISHDFDFSHFDLDGLSTHSITFSLMDPCTGLSQCETNLTLLPEAQLYIPNTFSQFALDARDRYFGVYGNQTIEFVLSVTIYNRWGGEVWHSQNVILNEPITDWSGDTSQNDERATTSSFVYVIKAIDIYGNDIIETGSLTQIH